MHWERLATIRTLILIVGGLACIIWGAWLWKGPVLGLPVAGVAALFLEFMTGGTPNAKRAPGA